MLTFCPEIKGGNYIAVQRGERGGKKPSLHPQKPFLNPSRKSTVASFIGSSLAVFLLCAAVCYTSKRKIGQEAFLMRLLCLP